MQLEEEMPFSDWFQRRMDRLFLGLTERGKLQARVRCRRRSASVKRGGLGLRDLSHC